MKDIEKRKDIEVIMESFYNRLLKDDRINYIFTDVAHVNIVSHLPVIIDFWEQNILKSESYKNNVLKIHQELNGKVKLSAKHFAVWLTCFYGAVDDHFKGENAENMKTRALSIATVMEIKLSEDGFY